MPERDPEHFDFAAFFSAKLKERGLTLGKLSELSGISIQDLKNMSEGDFDQLPAAPYLRGYTSRLAKILEFDPEIWWRHFEEIGVVKQSGGADRLPENRFAISRTARWRWGIAVVALLFIYGGLRFSKILGRPVVTVLDPQGETSQATSANFTIRGTVEGGSQIFINGEAAPLTAEGAWQKTILLEPGLNTIEIKSTKFLGRETSVIRQIFYEPVAAVPMPASSSPSSSGPASGIPASEPSGTPSGL